MTRPSIGSGPGSVTSMPPPLTHNDRSQLDQIAPHLTYLENNASLMRYARLRAVGLPVGSGVTEEARVSP